MSGNQLNSTGHWPAAISTNVRPLAETKETARLWVLMVMVRFLACQLLALYSAAGAFNSRGN